jgi:hypothetical protein
MSAINVKITATCNGNNHHTFSVTGDAQTTAVLTTSELLEPVTAQDVETFLRVLVKLGKIGRTAAQTRALFVNGVTVTL